MPLQVRNPSVETEKTLLETLKSINRVGVNRTIPPLFVDYQNQRVGIGKKDADFPLDVHVLSNFRKLIQGIGFFMSDNCTIGGFLSLGDNLMVNGDGLFQGGLQAHGKCYFWNGISVVGSSIEVDNILMRSPDGSQFRLTVDNEGVLSTTKI